MTSAPAAGLTLSLVAFASSTAAVAQPDLPWTTVPASVREGEQKIVAAHRAALEDSGGSYAARRLRARDRARVRACAAIHRLVDELLVRASVTPPELVALHDAVDAHCEVVGVRPTIDGGAVVSVAVSFDALEEAADPDGAPW